MNSVGGGILFVCELLCFAAALFMPEPVFGNAGMENIAYGAKSAGMGGTSMANSDDSLVMNTNPAGIARSEGLRADFSVELMKPMFSFENAENNTNGRARHYVIPCGGIMFRRHDSRWAFGIGIFNEGGTGTDYGMLKVDNNAMGAGAGISEMEYFSQFGFMKITPTIAFLITDRLLIALSPNIGYSKIKMKMPFYI
ncbi:MAG: hypothetical protein COX16_02830 [Deltaproteobacteria bacterium CG23_combo_of_CG06-09_8_20_14_all_51_20]|nr:MAG: hypothetical protein COX16_02830 [Deltaproteobacteria bacterium CG23_combo_of_CG06-09_8_20_14_all_51_20]PJB38426.1 MAG: hypothetical protein CO107_02325 [Deltaproteobacteria bacterium CG_4_9_14_3_um_filter_51_14]